MLRIFWVSVGLVIVASSPVPKDGEGSRIMNGKMAKDGQFPYAASLQQSWPTGGRDHVCTISLITTKTCLGAAHCLFDEDVLASTDVFCAIVGSLYQYPDFDCHKFKEIYYHDEYNSSEITYDIATFIFKEEVTLGDNIQLITLAGPNLQIEDEVVTSLGWGLTKKGGRSPHRLRFTTLHIVDISVCEELYGDLADNQVCIYDKKTGTCGGDSGGPFVLRGKNVQIGIVSYGSSSCDTQPTVATDVRKYKDWITEHSEGELKFTD